MRKLPPFAVLLSYLVVELTPVIFAGVHTHTYVCVCVCVCVTESLQIGSCGSPPSFTHPPVVRNCRLCSPTTNIHTHTHTHSHTILLHSMPFHAIPFHASLSYCFQSEFRFPKKKGNERGDFQQDERTIWPNPLCQAVYVSMYVWLVTSVCTMHPPLPQPPPPSPMAKPLCVCAKVEREKGLQEAGENTSRKECRCMDLVYVCVGRLCAYLRQCPFSFSKVIAAHSLTHSSIHPSIWPRSMWGVLRQERASELTALGLKVF